MMSATAVFNLMSLACARSGHYKVVTDMFERSLRFCPKVSSLPIQVPCAAAYFLLSKTIFQPGRSCLEWPGTEPSL